MFRWGRFSEKGENSILYSDSRINIWHGAVRSSKTVSSIVRWLEFALNGPEGDLLMIGKTERTLKRNILDQMEEIVGRKRMATNRGMGEIHIGNRRIYIAGANDERSESKIRGMTLAGAYGDELTLWPESFFTMLLSRLSVHGAKFFGTTNPDHPYHWLKMDYIDRAGELDLKAFHFELADNPNLDKAYIAALQKEYVGLWYKRFISGLWVLAEGAIYDMWDDDLNLFADADMPLGLKTYATRYITIDYGTTNPCVFLDIWDDGRTNWVYKEYFWDSAGTNRQKTDAQYADDLLEFLGDETPPIFILLDPSAASFKAELRGRGLAVKDADNDVTDGIRVMSSAIKHRIYRVHRDNCPNHRKEMSGYVWDAKARIRGIEQPIKTNDHSCDAGRYYCKTMLRPWRLQQAV